MPSVFDPLQRVSEARGLFFFFYAKRLMLTGIVGVHKQPTVFLFI